MLRKTKQALLSGWIAFAVIASGVMFCETVHGYDAGGTIYVESCK